MTRANVNKPRPNRTKNEQMFKGIGDTFQLAASIEQMFKEIAPIIQLAAPANHAIGHTCLNKCSFLTR